MTTYLSHLIITASMGQNPFQKLMVTQMIKKAPFMEAFLVHCRVDRSPQLDTVLSHTSQVHNLAAYFFKIHLILSSHVRLGLLSHLPMRAICLAHPVPCDLITLIIFREEYRLLSPASYYILPVTSKYSTQRPLLRHPQRVFFSYSIKSSTDLCECLCVC
jgi:hypothetical protein